MSTKNITPQVQTVLTHLINHGSISQAEAGLIYKIRALPRRISDLKEILASDEKYAGYEITRELKKDATGQRYARYALTITVLPKVGDRVQVTDKLLDNYNYYRTGDIGTVLMVCGDRDLFVQFDKVDGKYRDDDGQWYIRPESVEVIVNV
jgi:hypothetical protein